MVLGLAVEALGVVLELQVDVVGGTVLLLLLDMIYGVLVRVVDVVGKVVDEVTLVLALGVLEEVAHIAQSDRLEVGWQSHVVHASCNIPPKASCSHLADSLCPCFG